MKKETKKKIVKAVETARDIAHKYGRTRVADVVGLNQGASSSVRNVVGLRAKTLRTNTVAKTFGIPTPDKKKRKHKRK